MQCGAGGSFIYVIYNQIILSLVEFALDIYQKPRLLFWGARGLTQAPRRTYASAVIKGEYAVLQLKLLARIDAELLLGTRQHRSER